MPPDLKRIVFNRAVGLAVLTAIAVVGVAFLAAIRHRGLKEAYIIQCAGNLKQIYGAALQYSNLGYGPRFLHSTGQLHKGGPNNGVFLQITSDDKEDIPVPGQKYTFGILKRFQAQGDFEVLAERQRRLLRVHLGADVPAGLARLRDLIRAALA